MAATFYKKKDQNAVKDYTFDWSAETATGKTVQSGGTTVAATPAGLTVSAPTIATPNVTVRLSGGTVGIEYDVVCHAAFSNGESDDKTLRLGVVDE